MFQEGNGAGPGLCLKANTGTSRFQTLYIAWPTCLHLMPECTRRMPNHTRTHIVTSTTCIHTHVNAQSDVRVDTQTHMQTPSNRHTAKHVLSCSQTDTETGVHSGTLACTHAPCHKLTQVYTSRHKQVWIPSCVRTHTPQRQGCSSIQVSTWTR